MYYDDLNYARQRLTSTFIRTKKKTPIYVSSIDLNGNDPWCYFLDMETEIPDSINLYDVDISPVPLGYMNYDGIATYLTRKPERCSKQGLTERTIHAEGRANWLGIPFKSLAKTINNEYPSIEEALDTISKRGRSCAWHRCFAVSKNGLEYKGKTVGTVSKIGISLDKNYHYLTEFLHEALAENRLKVL